MDLLVEVAGGLVPLEIKLTATPKPRHVEALERFRSIAASEGVESGLLVCRVPERRDLPHGHAAIPWWELPG